MDRIRVLKFVNFFAIGGTERQFVTVARHLDPEEFDLHLACFRKWGDFLKEIEACGRPLAEYQLNSLLSCRTFTKQLRFAWHLRKQRIQVLHTYGFYPNVFAIPAAKLAGVPVIIASIRDIGAYVTPGQLKLQRAICRMADKIVVNANAVRDWLISDGYSAAKIDVIENAIVHKRQAISAGSSFRAEFGIPEDTPLVGVLSRLSAIKGLNHFLDAAAIVGRSHPSVRFLVIGDGDQRRNLEQQAERLGIRQRIIFTGFRTDTELVLSEVAVSVMPSLSEGLSNTLLESMSLGKPVVATRVGGNPEIVVEGSTGLLVEPQQSATLAEAILQLLSNPLRARQMGEAGRERVKQHFSVERAVGRTQQLYRDLMKQCVRKN